MATVEGSVQIDVAEGSHTLRYSTRALSRIESEFQPKKLQDVLKDLKDGLDIDALVTLFWCGLPPKLTRDDALDISDEIGLVKTGTLIGEAMHAAFPTADDGGDANGGKPRPRKAAAGTGSTS